MSSQGGREVIEAARKRLAAAKKQATSAAKTLESATETVDSAKKMAETAKQMSALAKKSADTAKRNADTAKSNVGKVTENRKAAHSQYDDSKKEVAEAEKFLKEAEGRWEVVAIDSDNESEENESRKKQKMANVDTILVEGCGMPEVNGTYKWSDDTYYNGVRQYCKQGQWKGRHTEFEIYYESHAEWKCWLIFGVKDSLYLFEGPRGEAAEMPSNGWKALHNGVNPAPTLKFM